MLFLFLLAASLCAADSPVVSPEAVSPEVLHARQELERVRTQAEAGLLPRAKIAEAEQAIDDAMDADVLARILYGHIQVEDLNEQQVTDMVNAAKRRAARVEKQVEHARDLIAHDVGEPFMFADLESELAQRQQAVEEAKARAALLMDIVEMAHAEATQPVPTHSGVRQREEHFEGDRDHLLEPGDVKAITLAFEKEFHEPFPVSARGATAVHRSMGFDHTGRIDVAVTPDSREGVWLRKYLEAKSIPYFAFRTAIAGKATGAHIHIGPGSTPIHAD